MSRCHADSLVAHSFLCSFYRVLARVDSHIRHLVCSAAHSDAYNDRTNHLSPGSMSYSICWIDYHDPRSIHCMVNCVGTGWCANRATICSWYDWRLVTRSQPRPHWRLAYASRSVDSWCHWNETSKQMKTQWMTDVWLIQSRTASRHKNCLPIILAWRLIRWRAIAFSIFSRWSDRRISRRFILITAVNKYLFIIHYCCWMRWQRLWRQKCSRVIYILFIVMRCVYGKLKITEEFNDVFTLNVVYQ